MATTIWKEKTREAKLNLELAQKELELAELQEKENGNRQGIEKWLDYDFDNSGTIINENGMTKEIKGFMKEIKAFVKKELSGSFELVSFDSCNGFDFSGFIKNKQNGKYVYFSGSDIRSWGNSWYDNLLIRTAENEKDYTGGSNDYCKLTDIFKKAEYLTQ